ncbi:MAG: hypothetical protein ACQESE_04380 [Nanobdellota archaeon]
MKPDNYSDINVENPVNDDTIEEKTISEDQLIRSQGRIINFRNDILKIDFGHHISRTDLTFKDLINDNFKRQYFDYTTAEPYQTLSNIKELMHPYETVIIEQENPMRTEDISFIAESIGFKTVYHKGNRTSLQKKEPYEKQSNGFILREVSSKEEYEKYLDFLEKIFEKEGLNYLKEVDELFSNHSETYILYEDNDIIGVSRNTWLLPGKVMPLQLATIQGSQEHISIDNTIRTGESLFNMRKDLGRKSLYVTQESLHALARSYSLKKPTGRVKSLTTNDAKDAKARDAYLKKLGYEEEEITLQYGDFGKEWNLISLSQERLEFLYHNPKQIVRNNYRI